MTTMTDKFVYELEGAQLNFAVATALGLRVEHEGSGEFAVWFDSYKEHPCYRVASLSKHGFCPSSKWEHGGPIIERERIRIGWAPVGETDSEKLSWAQLMSSPTCQYGPTSLIAAMRAFVASKLGDVVEVPA